MKQAGPTQSGIVYEVPSRRAQRPQNHALAACAQAGASDFDIVVVGGGGSGLATALAAASGEARVALIEKNTKLGGTTGLSIGSITASGTSLQRSAGIDDSPDAHFADFDLFAKPEGAVDNLAFRRLYVDHVADTLHWLMSLGIVFHGPSPEAPHTRPRMHNVLPHAGAYIHCLASACRARGVDIRVETAARGLVEEAGRVVGVEVDSSRGRGVLRARKGVVLTTGDYSAGTELLRQLAGGRYAAIGALNTTSTGDGHTLARALGAQVLNGHVVEGPQMRFAAPREFNWVKQLPPTRLVGQAVRWAMATLPRAVLQPVIKMYLTAHLQPTTKLFDAGAILVNRQGLRFSNERASPAFDIPGQEGGYGYIVFDGTIGARFERWPDFMSTAPGIAYAYLSDYRRYRRDIYRDAQTIETLARSLGVPEDALAKSVDTAPVPFSRPPYCALGPLYSWLMTTDGGLAVTPKFEVLHRDGRAIPGLYAAGIAGQGGVLLPGHGQHLGWAFTSGRLCGLELGRL